MLTGDWSFPEHIEIEATREYQIQCLSWLQNEMQRKHAEYPYWIAECDISATWTACQTLEDLIEVACDMILDDEYSTFCDDAYLDGDFIWLDYARHTYMFPNRDVAKAVFYACGGVKEKLWSTV